ncbi:hypothetical protein MPDQ_004496 [Monascus purpureus]|uniref:Uncharacterized protein n=1 Tax=Monascus purpureus TaxID=5098 RepID=A0A507QJS7_MONPU|nr:hypothetical protein MPDQ_004496 [Monascus purpureus]
MHWALPALEACLPPELFAKIPTIQVDSVEGAKGQDRFRFLDLETGTDRYNVPMENYYCLNRRKFRGLLSIDIDVNWARNTPASTSTTTEPTLIARSGPKAVL